MGDERPSRWRPLHGAPLRAVVPGYIGARSVKWLERIELLAEPSEGYYQATAYRLFDMPLGEVALNSDILSASSASGRTDAAGLRVRRRRAPRRARGGVRRRRGELDARPSCSRTRAPGRGGCGARRSTLDPGRHELLVRAWDSAGATQPESPATVWNPKGYANSAWGRLVVEV